ncbi:MAG: hypothetical protein Q4F27_03920 [Desulfovibrionaceae bacterium]|nr:hypothetical protein [Desulfovibrionaceae bacterium]
MKRSVSLLILVILLSSCAGRNMSGSFCGSLPGDEAVAHMAQDAVAFLSNAYPPGHTALFLLPARNANNAFARSFENGLRMKGFTILAEDKKDALAVAYTLDSLLDESAWYLQLRLSDGRALARAYDAAGFPEAGRSATESDSPRTLLEQAKDKGQGLYDQAAEIVSE